MLATILGLMTLLFRMTLIMRELIILLAITESRVLIAAVTIDDPSLIDMMVRFFPVSGQ